MRLTLRVLLAYLDNILEPADAKAVEAKIAESENVSTLVHHIREITKRMRVSAPEVLGKGLGLDPNTVAEYLDYGLSDDGVRDFENVCMTSDVHMAEVAACHEILSLVLVKPAEIDPNTRQRMYKLLHEPQQAVLRAEPVGPPVPSASAPLRPATAPAAAPAATSAAAHADQRRKSEVPDYLRQPDEEEAPVAAGTNYFFLALAVAALIVAGTIGALAFTPHNSLPGFLKPWQLTMFPAMAPDDVAEAPAANIAAPVATPTVIATPAATGTLPIVTATAPATTVTTVAPTPTATAMVATAGEGLRQPASALTTAAVAPPASTAAVVAPVPSNVMPATAPPAPSATMPMAAATASPVVVAAPAVSGSPAKIEQVGRVSSDMSQVLLRFNPQQGWVRVQPRDVVVVGDRLLALPGYRPQVALANGLTFDMLAGSAVELLPLDAAGTPGVRLLRGRLMLFTVGGPQGKLLLEDGMKQVTLTLGGGAEVALEHLFRRYVGTDPAGGPLPWALVVTVKSGELGWSGRAGEQQSLKGPGQWVLTDSTDVAPLAGGLPPAWMSVDERDLLERQAADYLETALRGGKAVKVALEETVGDRRSENQQLALRCLAQLGAFDDYLPILNDATQRYATYDRYLGYMSEAMDWGPFYAESVRAAMIKHHGPAKGAELYRMLWSYDDEQLRGGMAKYLVETLDHEELDFRTLAYWNLTRITGLSISYAPQDPPLKRRPNIQKWVQKLELGQIVHKMP